MSQPGGSGHLEIKEPHKPVGRELVERAVSSVAVLYALSFSNLGQEVQLCGLRTLKCSWDGTFCTSLVSRCCCFCLSAGTRHKYGSSLCSALDPAAELAQVVYFFYLD